MKCEKHPESDAVGLCVACGRGVCPICKLSYTNLIHCKDCVESGRIGPQYKPVVQQYPPQSAYQPYPGYGSPYGYQPYPYYPYGPYPYPYAYMTLQPKPIGVPSKHYFNMGRTGALAMTILCIITALLVYPTLLMGSSGEAVILPVLFGIFLIAMTPLLYGLYGFYINYGTANGLYALSGIGIGTILLFILTVAGTAPLSNSDSAYTYFGVIWLFMGSVSFGIGIVAMGASLEQVKRYMDPMSEGYRNIGRVTVLSLIAGLLFMVMLGMFIIGWVLLGLAMMFLSQAFDQAPVPEASTVEKKSQDDFFITSQGGQTGPQMRH